MRIPQRLELALADAMQVLGLPGAEAASGRCTVSACHDPRFGDYQTNMALLAANATGKKPRDLAGEIVGKLRVEEICRRIQVAGPGFINFELKPETVAAELAHLHAESRHAGIEQCAAPSVIVIDFSSPNIAKAMHVGHIRSTFLGDALARTARAMGHRVITDNHLGDWGTQFGKLIHACKHMRDQNAPEISSIEELDHLYREAHARSERDPTVLAAVRKELALLQAGDQDNVRIWKQIAELSLREFNHLYMRLGVTFDHYLGESFYNPMLTGTVEELRMLGIAEESEGATCIFFREDPELKNSAPMLIRKSDGAFLYATTDLAAVHYRLATWKADEILYVTDSRQQLHFKQLFTAIRRWLDARTAVGKSQAPRLKHVFFGSILGPDRKPFQTRSGEPVRLADLLDEATSRALKVVREKNPDLDEQQQFKAAQVLGMGALKYADLAQNRNLDYTFDWDKLLALQGNTAPYLIYAYVRICSIFKAGGAENSPRAGSAALFELMDPAELMLAKHLIQFSDAVHSVLQDYRPHLLTNYLYELAVRFSKFYETCPVLKADEPSRSERLALCHLSARTLQRGLHLLGIETLEQM